MVCHLSGAKPLSKLMLGYCQLDPEEKTSVKFYQNTKLYIHKNESENTKLYIHKNESENIIYEMTAILSRGEMSSYDPAGMQHQALKADYRPTMW